MKKYVKMIPLMLYPYAYMIYMFFVMGIEDKIIEKMWELPFDATYLVDFMELFLVGVAIVYNLYVIISTIYYSVKAIKEERDAYEMAKINMLIKGVQIPAYIINFLLGLSGMAILVVGGIGIIIMMIIVDLITITLSGIHSIGCSIRMKKEGILSDSAFVLMTVGSFIYCVDVLIAILYVKRAKKGRAVV